MRRIEENQMDAIDGRRLGEQETFRFRCHPGIACFNRCCRNLNLFLYPYDVIRLKHRLGMDSDRFINRHLDVVLREGSHFPSVLLRMSEDDERSCPFLKESGCSVYPDRPDTCRTFPLEQGVEFNGADGRVRRVHFFRPPDFCLGPQESARWTPRTWAQDQEAAPYHRMTLRWSKVYRLFRSDPWGPEGPDGPKAKMAFMATYNLDRFRDFVFGSSFLARYRLDAELEQAARRDDVALLEIGLEWIRWFLWALPGGMLRPR